VKLSVWRIAGNRLRTARILSVKSEGSTVKVFSFTDKQCAAARPGQFLMLWVPGVDEIPLSVLGANDGDVVSVAVKNVGDATRELQRKEQGDVVGVRGPFGKGFTLAEGRLLLVGGGTGVAPLLFLARKQTSKVSSTVFVVGAKSEDELLFMDELRRADHEGKLRLAVSTEDGSCGVTGLCTEPLERLLAQEKFDMIYTCGPEPMMLKVFKIAERFGVRVEASLERLMRCAVGLCGSCVIGRYRVCADGPVFSAEQLREVRSEFGVSKLDFDGKRISL
jgi:dihydroorotate dehydrogenase electron transfer subunit